jgi:hypothetical protein
MFFTGEKVNIGQFSRDNTEKLVGDYVENTKKLSDSDSPKDAGNRFWNNVGRR